MSSVSPKSSISQMVSTMGGCTVVAPSQELLDKLESSVAAKLLSEYYAAIVAVSQGGSQCSSVLSSTVSRSSSRMGKRERKVATFTEANAWRERPGYCYTRLIVDKRVVRCAETLGPNPTLEQLCLLTAEYARSEDELKELRVSFENGSYHVSSDGDESVPDFLRRCASCWRGKTGVLMNLFGFASFGSPVVDWKASVGVRTVTAEWTPESAPGVLGFLVDKPLTPADSMHVVFPAREENTVVHIAEGIQCEDIHGKLWVVGPAWLSVDGPDGLRLHVKSLGPSITAWWGQARVLPEVPSVW